MKLKNIKASFIFNQNLIDLMQLPIVMEKNSLGMKECSEEDFIGKPKLQEIL